MIDIDFLAMEYDNGRANALVEYKNEHAAPQYPTHPSYRAMVDLGNRAGVPVLAVRYASDFSWWRVTPLNDLARKYVPELCELKEPEWVALLYTMRDRKMPGDIFSGKNLEL